MVQAIGYTRLSDIDACGIIRGAVQCGSDDAYAFLNRHADNINRNFTKQDLINVSWAFGIPVNFGKVSAQTMTEQTQQTLKGGKDVDDVECEMQPVKVLTSDSSPVLCIETGERYNIMQLAVAIGVVLGIRSGFTSVQPKVESPEERKERVFNTVESGPEIYKFLDNPSFKNIVTIPSDPFDCSDENKRFYSDSEAYWYGRSFAAVILDAATECTGPFIVTIDNPKEVKSDFVAFMKNVDPAMKMTDQVKQMELRLAPVLARVTDDRLQLVLDTLEHEYAKDKTFHVLTDAIHEFRVRSGWGIPLFNNWSELPRS